MSIIAAALKHMLAAGVPHDTILAAVADMEAKVPKDVSAERRRRNDRERKQALRATSEGRWHEVREIVFERDNYTCTYCGTSTDSPHCDHVFPLSLGGASVEGNLTTSCSRCNISKGARTVEEWRGA